VSQVTYGGQAVIEGVMIRGGSAVAIAARRPDGSLALYREPLRGLYTSPLRRVPGLRGVLVLGETLLLGIRALSWSAAVAANEVGDDGKPRVLGGAELLIVLGMFGVVVAGFFVGPVLATVWLDGIIGAPAAIALEGLIRIALLLGYIWAIGRSDDVRRVFQYHGAEHMTIAAFEQGRDLEVPAIRRFPKEHPRCGTSFLLTVAVVSILVFALAGTDPLWWRISSRLILLPVVAGLAYEVIRFAGLHQRWPVVRWLFAGNLALQWLTTRAPDDEQIQVAVAALEACQAEERASRG
jgi:uncharacterized protein YqhQ